MKICLLGAESTGKSTLCAQLGAHLASAGLAVHVVPEFLRDWCARQGRTPLQHEQASIALAQMASVQAAPAGHWVLADTSALMIAVYSDRIFGDPSLYDMALAHQKQYDLTLLTGLDLPWVADGLQRDGPHVREPVDRLVRQALDRAALPYRVVYGQGAQRLQNACLALPRSAGVPLAPGASQARGPALTQGRWQGVCERCDDPACEHRLFGALTSRPKRPQT
jgi:HTH-type transcriptional regulator, transcriptional repressor of NAD biosynthesis genes